MSPDVGFRVAPGDPGALFAAASYHSDVADGLSGHAGNIAGTAAGLQSTWNGEAAASYQALSSAVADHFRTAAATSRSAAESLRRYGTELERIQHEGTVALHQAEHWLDELDRARHKLTLAQRSVINAQRAVTDAQSQVRTAAAAGPTGAAAATAAAGSLTAAQGELTRAQGDERTAQREVDEAEHQLAHWQRRGLDLWQEAQDIALRATGELSVLVIPSPPLAELPPPGGGTGPSWAHDWLPHSANDFALIGLGGFGAYQGQAASRTIDGLERAQRLNRTQIARERIIAENPDAPPAARSAAEGELNRLDGVAHDLSGELSGAEQLGNYADHLLGPAGGVLDAATNLAAGHGVVKSVEQGVASTVGGYVGAAGGAAACTATGVLAPAAPVCAGVGGAVLGWMGDKLAGLL